MQNSNEKLSKTLLVINAAAVIILVIVAFIIYSAFHVTKRKKIQPVPLVTPTAFNDVNIEAKAAYVFDVYQNKVIYKKNEFTQLPLASLTKLMMALTAESILPKDSGITIKKEFLGDEGDTGLLSGESWKLKNLLDFTLIVSSNDGAKSIASVAGAFDLKSEDYGMGLRDFVTKMNLKAQELGLKQTYFVNENGLDIGEVSGGYGSAMDVAKLLQYILTAHPDLLEATKYSELKLNSETKTHLAKNTNTGIGTIPGLIASKTGYTDLAGGNLAIAFDSSIGRPIIVVVLGSTLEGRFTDVKKLVSASLDYIKE